jgi:N-acetylglucosaminyl-diphospho-decaprenol L-rhamnosyltransferase
MSPLSIVIVNYHSGELLKDCLTALFNTSSTLDLEVFVINNDSTHDLAPVLNQEWSKVEFIQNNTNLGFAAGANIGFRKSKGEFVLVLNPDVLVQDQSVETLVNTLRNNADAGLALPLLRNPDGTLQYSCRRFYSYTTLVMRRAPFNRFFPSHAAARKHLMLDWNHDNLARVDWGLGAAMLVRRSALQDSCLFDERFFLYFEDVDLCIRLRRWGWKVLYDPRASMIHHHRRESAQHMFHPAKRHHFLSLMKFLWKYRFRLPESEEHRA